MNFSALIITISGIIRYKIVQTLLCHLGKDDHSVLSYVVFNMEISCI